MKTLFSWYSRLPMTECDWPDTWQVVHSVSHFVYEFVEFEIVFGHGQSPILSSSFLDMDRALFFRTSHLTKLMSQRDFCCENRNDKWSLETLEVMVVESGGNFEDYINMQRQNQTKRIDFDNTINLSSLIVNLAPFTHFYSVSVCCGVWGKIDT